MPQCLEKITALRRYLNAMGYTHIEIEVDGNVSFENARKMSDAGADIFVAGTSSLFRAGTSMKESVAQLRAAIQ